MVMSITEEFARQIEPFSWEENGGIASVHLNIGEYLHDVFNMRSDYAVTGSGYDWTRLAQKFLEEQCPHLLDAVEFEPVDDQFCAYSKSPRALREFICSFKEACEDRRFIADLFSRTNLA